MKLLFNFQSFKTTKYLKSYTNSEFVLYTCSLNASFNHLIVYLKAKILMKNIYYLTAERMEKERRHRKNQKWANGKLANNPVSITKVISIFL